MWRLLIQEVVKTSLPWESRKMYVGEWSKECLVAVLLIRISVKAVVDIAFFTWNRQTEICVPYLHADSWTSTSICCPWYGKQRVRDVYRRRREDWMSCGASVGRGMLCFLSYRQITERTADVIVWCSELGAVLQLYWLKFFTSASNNSP